MRPTLTLLAGLLLAVAATGCTSTEREFPGQGADILWTAMIAVAETPDYRDVDGNVAWFVKENVVWPDEPRRRLEIYREVVRYDRITSVKPRRERRTFRLEITLLQDPQTIQVLSRGTGTPKHAQDEADRFLADVASLVGAEGEPMPGVPSDPGGAASPEVAVRNLLHAMFVADRPAIERVILPTKGATILWAGTAVDELPPAARVRLERRLIRQAALGEIVVIDGRDVVVSDQLVNDDRTLVIATVGGQPLNPFVVVRIDDRWRVDPRPMIERRRRPTKEGG